MIPLRFKAHVEGDGRQEFVVKLLGGGDAGHRPEIPKELLDAHGASLVAELSEELVFKTTGGYLHIPNGIAADLIGDVVYVDARRGNAYRWIRARSPHNTLMMTERCDQLCVMCSQPPKARHVDFFDHFLTAIQLAPPNTEVGISGGEPTLYKEELFHLLGTATAARPDLRFHVLTNAQHFTSDDLPFLRDYRLGRVCWGVPLYAADETLHDKIVGKEGAFGSLTNSLALLLQAGASVELRTVIMQWNLTGLPELARYVATHLGFVQIWALMQLENIGFARMNWEDLFVDHSIFFEPIADAVDLAVARGINVQLYNCPLCTVPANYRRIAGRTISDWKQRYLSVCSTCQERQRCSGFFEWYQEPSGFKGVSPL